MSEREILEIEVATHRTRVEEINAILREAREDKESQLLRTELRAAAPPCRSAPHA